MNASRRIKKTADGDKGNKLVSTSSSPPYNFFHGISADITSSPLNLLDSAASLLRGRENIIVLCGAGISVSCGIPDFRSKGGIYDMIDANDYGLSTPEEIFHYEIFQDNPRLFYKFAGKMLYPSEPHEPSPSHKFLSLLNEKKMLLRVYTQNVDGLEEKAGLPPKKVVYAHGSLHTSKCLKCGAKYDTESYRHEVLSGNVPYCKRIISRRKKRKLNESHEDEGQNCNDEIAIACCGGILKPNITFFGEPLDDRVTRCLEVDRKKADAVIVIGTSLSVAPISKIVEFLCPSIPRILVNRTIVIPKHTDCKNSNKRDDGDVEEKKTKDEETKEEVKEEDEKEQVDFRNGYLFDALLLGFCDDITGALAHVLWNKRDENHEEGLSSGENRGSLPLNLTGCKLLRDDMAQIKELGTSCLLHHPPERILVFRGAVWKAHEGREEEEEEKCYQEIVNCNECNCVITGMVFKCNDCFDYDLCKACHSKVKRKRSHHGGKHKFTVEEASG